MEKFSAYRDPGTGIQPFLTPVPPSAPDALTTVLVPVRYTLGLLRTVIVAALAFIYFALVQVLCAIFTPLPPLHRALTHLLTFILAKLTFLVLGLWWIPVQNISRKRGGRNGKNVETWNPSPGDIIISNWTSWIELVWLAGRFNPVFVVPVPESSPLTAATSGVPATVTHTPGRRTGTGSANVQLAAKHSAAQRVPIKGFYQVSLLRLINLTGSTPSPLLDPENSVSLETIRISAGRPVVVLPECTTSNGRGLLRFVNVFHQTVPVKNYRVFVMCVRYDSPTSIIPSLTLPIPSSWFNPIPHVFSIGTSLAPLPISIRLLAPSEGPSSQLFLASEFVTGSPDEDQLAEASANLIAQIGKFKRTGMGWEDKANFLEYRRAKKTH